MKLRGPVLVGTDFTAASDEALRQGNDFAKAFGTSLIVCHVVPDLDMINVLFPQLAAGNAERNQILTDKAMAAVEQQIATNLIEPAKVSAVVDSGTPHAGLLTRADAAGAGLIVLGPGRTADRVVRHARVPALIARHSRRGIVIGATDFSDPSMPALEAAAAEAERRGSQLHLLHVVDVGTFTLADPAAAGLPFFHGIPGFSVQTIDDLRTAAQNRLHEALTRFAIDGEVIAESGPAAQTIVNLADSSSAELVVVGTHGRTGLSRLTLGSTAEAVIRSATCSVLVVRLTP
jgi:nucleotide-binding universal stress UspA family protein